jgi:hypothetical protein
MWAGGLVSKRGDREKSSALDQVRRRAGAALDHRVAKHPCSHSAIGFQTASGAAAEAIMPM